MEKELKVGQSGWAVKDPDGNFIDVFTHEVTRDNLVLFESETIVEVVITEK